MDTFRVMVIKYRQVPRSESNTKSTSDLAEKHCKFAESRLLSTATLNIHKQHLHQQCYNSARVIFAHRELHLLHH